MAAYPYDAALLLEDGVAAVTATRYGQKLGAAAIYDTGVGPAMWDGYALTTIQTIDLASGNEAYRLVVEGSNSAVFASGVVELSAISVTAVGEIPLAIVNQVGVSIYRYIRLKIEATGTTPSIRLTSFLAKRTAVDGLSFRQLVSKFQELLDRGIEEPDYVYPEEFDPLAGSSESRDDADALQAMIDNAYVTKRIPSLRPGKHYWPRRTITADPSRVGFRGNSGIIDWKNQPRTDPTTQPELFPDPSFLTNTGMVISPYDTLQASISGGNLLSNVRTGIQDYLERGWKIIAPIGSVIDVTLTINSIVTHIPGVTPFRDLGVRFKVDDGWGGGSVGNGAAAAPSWFYSNSASDYAPGVTVTHRFVLTAADPYLCIQSNASISVAACSVKVVPSNTGLLLRSTPAGQAVHDSTWRHWENLLLINSTASVHAIGAEFDTQVAGYTSRCTWDNVTVSGGWGRAMLWGNRAYLMNFKNCRAIGSEVCIETVVGAADAGENIRWDGGNIGGSKIGILNRAGFAIRFNSSIDFCRQWYVGAGGFMMHGGWLETNAPTEVGYPLIDVTGGHVALRDTLIQVDGSTVPVLATPFRVAKGGWLDIEASHPYNLHGTTGALCEGEGRFTFRGRGGASKEIDPITKRDAAHNLFGPGGAFAGAVGTPIDVPLWITTATTPYKQVDGRHLAYTTEGSFAGTVSRGSNVITGVTASLNIGWEITLPGFAAGTTIWDINFGASTITVTKSFDGAGGAKTVTYRQPTTDYSSAELTGTELKLHKNQGGANLIAYLAFPVEPDRAIGCELEWKVGAGGAGTANLYFQGHFARLTDNGGLVPDQTNRVFVSDLPKLSLDMVAGTSWAKVSMSTTRTDATSEHDGYCPKGCTHFVISINLSSIPITNDVFIRKAHANLL